jgi:hypothetical protein
MEYKFTKSGVNAEKLHKELSTAIYWKEILGVSIDMASVTVIVNGTLSPSDITLCTTTINNHSPIDIEKILESRIADRMEFGRKLMIAYSAKRALRGTGIEDTTRVLQKTAPIMSAVMAGSLEVALNILEHIPVDEDILQSDIDEFKAKIRGYLGI